MSNQRETLQQALTEELATVGYGRGTVQSQREQAIVKAARRASLDTQQILRLINGAALASTPAAIIARGDVFHDRASAAQAVNQNTTNGIHKAYDTAGRDVAIRIGSRAQQEGKDAAREIA